MLMFGVIMSGDTGEQVCVLQNRRLHEVNAKFIFDDEAMFASARLCSEFCIPRRSLRKRAHRGAVLRQVWRGNGAAMVICLDEPILFGVSSGGCSLHGCPTGGGAMFWITRVGHFFDDGDGCATKCEAKVSIFVGGGLVGERPFG